MDENSDISDEEKKDLQNIQEVSGEEESRDINVATLSDEEREILDQVEEETQMNSVDLSKTDFSQFEAYGKPPLFSLVLFIATTIVTGLCFFLFQWYSTKQIFAATTQIPEGLRGSTSALFNSVSTGFDSQLSQKNDEIEFYRSQLSDIDSDLEKNKIELSAKLNNKSQEVKDEYEQKIASLEASGLSQRELQQERETLQKELEAQIALLQSDFDNNLQDLESQYESQIQEANAEVERLQNEKESLQSEKDGRVLTAEEQFQEIARTERETQLLLDQLQGAYQLVIRNLQSGKLEEASAAVDSAIELQNGLKERLPQSYMRPIELENSLLQSLKLQALIRQQLLAQVEQGGSGGGGDGVLVPAAQLDSIVEQLTTGVQQLRSGESAQSAQSVSQAMSLFVNSVAGSLPPDRFGALADSTQEYYGELEKQFEVLSTTFRTVLTQFTEAQSSLDAGDLSVSLTQVQETLLSLATAIGPFLGEAKATELRQTINLYYDDWQVLLNTGFFINLERLQNEVENFLDKTQASSDSMNIDNWQDTQESIMEQIVLLFTNTLTVLDDGPLRDVLEEYNKNLLAVIGEEKALQEGTYQELLTQDQREVSLVLSDLRDTNAALRKELSEAQETILLLLKDF